MLEKIKGKVGKLDKKALAAAVVLMFLSWAALPIVYFLIVKRKRIPTIDDAGAKENGKVIVKPSEVVKDA